jgi:hypothetical protein
MNEEFWERTNRRIKECGFTQGSLSKKCGFRDPRRIENLSGPGKLPKVEELIKITKELDTSLDYLLFGYDNSGITKKEQYLLTIFRQLAKSDKDEIIEIVKIKNAKEDKASGKPADKQSMVRKDHHVGEKGA